MGWCASEALIFPLEFKLPVDTEAVTAGRWAYKVIGFQPNILESLHGPMTLGKGAKETAMLSPNASMPPGEAYPGSELLLSGSIWPWESLQGQVQLSDQCLQAGTATVLGRILKPGYMHQHMGLLLLQTPLVNFHHCLHHCPYSMKATIKTEHWE